MKNDLIDRLNEAAKVFESSETGDLLKESSRYIVGLEEDLDWMTAEVERLSELVRANFYGTTGL